MSLTAQKQLAEIKARVSAGGSFSDLRGQNFEFFMLTVQETLERELGHKLVSADHSQTRNRQAKGSDARVEKPVYSLVAVNNSQRQWVLNFCESIKKLFMRLGFYEGAFYLYSRVKRIALQFVKTRIDPQGGNGNSERHDEHRKAKKDEVAPVGIEMKIAK